jgi:hypothetical protein
MTTRKEKDQVMNQRATLVRQRLKTPRAAAVAGILFAVLFVISMTLLRSVLPEDLAGSDTADWLHGNTGLVSVALTLVPFAGIAFLWFMGVVRAHLGNLEDQFFSSVMFGSGLLFLAMVFVAAAIAGAIVAGYAIAADELATSGVWIFGRALMYTIMNVYAIRMAAVFMISLDTIWLQTRVVPRALVFITYALALLLLVAISFSLWVILIFPAWVFVISVYILRDSWRGKEAEAEGLIGSGDVSQE